MIDRQAIIDRHPLEQYLSRSGVIFHGSGDKVTANQCGVTKHKKGHLCVSIDLARNIWNCHDCNKGGGVIDWEMAAHGVDFKEAVRRLGGAVAVVENLAPIGVKPTAERQSRPPRMTDAEFDAAHEMSKRLAGDFALCERIALSRADRGWKANIIQGLAGEGVLGWHEGKAAFIYESGIKLRWSEDGKRMIRHHCGAARDLWRVGMLTKDVRRVYITEGETDAITLLCQGWEQGDHSEAVLALPSASVIPANVGELLAGRHVVIIPDQDEAGARATQKLIAALTGKASTLKTWRMSK